MFPEVCIKMVRDGGTIQLKWELGTYQVVGKDLLLQSLSIHWNSRHAVILATQ